MQFISTTALGGLLLLSGTALAAAPQAFDYTLNPYPTGGADCNVVAQQLGQAFQRATSLPVTKALCTKSTDLGATIVITYTAAAPLTPVSTLDEAHGREGRGAYLTLDDCQAALPGEVARFKAATGLTPLVSYCFEDVFSDTYPYALRIDAFGAAAAQPHVAEITLFGSPTDAGALQQQVLDAVRARGVDASYVTYEDTVGTGELQMLEYSATPHDFFVPDVGSLRDPAQCATESQVLQAALQGRADAPLVDACGADSVLDDVILSPIFLDHPGLDFDAAPETFDSYDACAQARPTVLAHYQLDLHRPVVAVLCGVPSSGGLEPSWGITLVETHGGLQRP